MRVGLNPRLLTRIDKKASKHGCVQGTRKGGRKKRANIINIYTKPSTEEQRGKPD